MFTDKAEVNVGNNQVATSRTEKWSRPLSAKQYILESIIIVVMIQVFDASQQHYYTFHVER